MFNEKKLMWLHGLTSAHVGSGDNLSYVDLPIQREMHTGFPKIEASSLKGAIRHHVESQLKLESKDEDKNKKIENKNKVEIIFGRGSGEKLSADDSTANEKAESSDKGAASEMAISDARILFFPVKSAKGIFAWVTCPMVIKRFEQDCQIVEKEITAFEGLKDDDVIVCKDSKLLIDNSTKKSNNNTGKKDVVMLEELVFEINESNVETALDGWIDSIAENFPLSEDLDDFKSRVILIPNNDFNYFVMQATEVITRIAIDSDVGVVKSEVGALFTEEYLPPESILYSMLFLKNKKKDNIDIAKTLNDYLNGKIVQIGGDATLGKGMFRIKLNEGGVSDEPESK